MVVNHQTQRFVTSFRGTVGNTELAIEVLMSIVPVKFTIQNIENGWVDNYFQVRYLGALRELVVD